MNAPDVVYAACIALGVSGLTVDGAVKLLPKPTTGDFFEVHGVAAERTGTSAVLYVDRSIKRPIHMAWTVRVFERDKGGWHEVCVAEGGPILYRPDVVLEQPVTLDWWTWGQCPSLPNGRVMIETTWAPTQRSLQPVTATAEVE